MAQSLTLDERRLGAAMKLLEREQREFLPSKSEIRQYKLLNFFAAVFIGLFFAFAIYAIITGQDPPDAVFYSVAIAAAVTVALFASNLGFFKKLRRLDRMRDDLGLNKRLERFFTSGRTVIAKIIMPIASVAYPVVAFVLIFFVISSLLDSKSRQLILDQSVIQFGIAAAMLGAIVVIGILIALLPAMWRAHSRQRIITELQRNLSNKDGVDAGAEWGQELASEAMGFLGDTEFLQISAERQQILMAARNESTTRYSIQQSAEFFDAKTELGVEDLLKVEDTIHKLESKPDPEGIRNTDDGLTVLDIPGTELQIMYKVDTGDRRVSISHLLSADGSD